MMHVEGRVLFRLRNLDNKLSRHHFNYVTMLKVNCLKGCKLGKKPLKLGYVS